MRYLIFCAIANSIIIAVSIGLSLPPSQEFLNIDPAHLSSQPTIDPCTLADSPKLNASMQLSRWLECQINGFYPFPANKNWPAGHARSFSRSLKFTFNETHYDFNGSLQLYKSFNKTLGEAFHPFKHGHINTLGVPNANGDKGGFVYMIGWAGGFQTRARRNMYFTNAAFAVVGVEQGERKIVEFRESGNIPNTAVLPEPVEWGCEFK